LGFGFKNELKQIVKNRRHFSIFFKLKRFTRRAAAAAVNESGKGQV
jgi:hypothetical protein